MPESEIAVVGRYSTNYFYFRLDETGDNLLIQTTQGVPRDIQSPGERVWRGKLETVGTVIFRSTTQQGLKNAGLPRDESIPVINTGETPEYLRKIFPAYSAIIVLWLLSDSLAGLEEEQTASGFIGIRTSAVSGPSRPAATSDTACSSPSHSRQACPRESRGARIHRRRPKLPPQRS